MGTKPTRLSGSYNTGVRLPLEAGLRLPGPHLPLLRPRQLGGLRLLSRLPSPPGLHPYHHPHLPLHQRQLPLAPPQAQESPPRHPGPPLFQPPIPILMTWEPQASPPSRPRDLDPPRPRPQFLPLRLLPGAQASRPSRPRDPGLPRFLLRFPLRLPFPPGILPRLALSSGRPQLFQLLQLLQLLLPPPRDRVAQRSQTSRRRGHASERRALFIWSASDIGVENLVRYHRYPTLRDQRFKR